MSERGKTVLFAGLVGVIAVSLLCGVTSGPLLILLGSAALSGSAYLREKPCSECGRRLGTSKDCESCSEFNAEAQTW